MDDLDPFNKIAIAFLVAALAYWWYHSNKRSVPTKWQPVGTVTHLFIYPLKGGRRVELDHALCTPLGFIMPKSRNEFQFRDRNLMIYKEGPDRYCFYSQQPLIEVSAVDEDHFQLRAPGMPDLTIKLPDDSSSHGMLTFWNEERIKKLDCGDEASKWLSNYLIQKDSGIRLAFFDTRFHRDIQSGFKKGIKQYPNLKNKAAGLFSNLSSYMIVNQASVDDLSSRIPEEDITINNFRPNIVVQDKCLMPFAEDHWKWIKIGNAILYAVKPCLRCSITTVNPETGVRSPQYEPLKTLQKYRQLKDTLKIELEGTKVVMGNQMGLEHEGRIKVGDTVYVGV